MKNRIPLKESLLIIFFVVLVATGVVLLFHSHFQHEEQFMGDKRVEKIVDHNFMLSEEEAREEALKYITEEEAIAVAKKEGLQEGQGWITGFYYRGTDDYDYVWAVHGQSGEEDHENQVIINAKTKEVVSIMEIPVWYETEEL